MIRRNRDGATVQIAALGPIRHQAGLTLRDVVEWNRHGLSDGDGALPLSLPAARESEVEDGSWKALPEEGESHD